MSQDELCHKDKGLGKLSEITPLNLTEHFRKNTFKNFMQLKRCHTDITESHFVCGQRLRQVQEIMRLVLQDASPAGY